ncbi:MAG: sulfatase [Planctomycetaceae bacterium]|nr:sulfatase [Planctomycetaceae bacterium]
MNCNRREWMMDAGGGFAGLALSALLAADAGAETDQNFSGLHHPAKVKRVVQLFMNGGVSPMDTFDPKPRLQALDGTRFDPGDGQKVESVTGSPGFKVLKSPFKFRQYGESGRWVSSVFPHVAGIVDDLTFLMSMTSKSNVHGLASYMQNTGFTLPGFPCLGAWISFALGRITDELPTFVVMPDAKGLPYNNQGNFSAGFLPAQHQGTMVKASAPNPIAHLRPPQQRTQISPASEQAGRRLLEQLNQRHLTANPGDSRLQARIESYQLAARMQLTAPQLFDLAAESEATQRAYGLEDAVTEDFGRRCLLARRMLEQGVRFVQVWSGPSGPSNNWDNHQDIDKELPYIARQVDQPIAALIRDLKSRGMLDDTLVIWTTEFGRMPFSQNTSGRDHNGGTFVTWLAGAGLKPGVAYGQSDEWGWKAVIPIWCYDLHATILHLMGVDHTRLTFKHNGIDRRLTDVHGHVIEDVLV